MKKIALSLLAALLLFVVGCGSQMPGLQNKTEIESTTEKPTTEETETKIFSYSEIDSKFGPGPFSVNELSKIFGEPVKLFGAPIYGPYGICLLAQFDGITFDLIPRDDSISFYNEHIWNDGAFEQPVTQQDKDVQIIPYKTMITGDKIDFIRGIKTGDSKEKVIAAYGGYVGEEWEREDITYVYYSYRPDKIIKYTDDEVFNLASQTGGISYGFVEGKLTEICVAWYDGYLAFD